MFDESDFSLKIKNEYATVAKLGKKKYWACRSAILSPYSDYK